MSCGSTGPDLKKHTKKSEALTDVSFPSPGSLTLSSMQISIHAYLCSECTEDAKRIKQTFSEKVLEGSVLRNLILLLLLAVALTIPGFLMSEHGLIATLLLFVSFFPLGAIFVLPGLFSRIRHKRDLISPFIQFKYSMFGIREHAEDGNPLSGKTEPYFAVRSPKYKAIFSMLNPGVEIVLDPYLEDNRSPY